MKAYRRQKWILLAVMTLGGLAQVSTCREQASLFGLRTLFSAFTLPINQLILAFFQGIQQAV